MIQRQKVQLQELAVVFNNEVKEESNERCLQGFFTDCGLDEDQVAFVLSLFLVFGKVDLCLDSTYPKMNNVSGTNGTLASAREICQC